MIKIQLIKSPDIETDQFYVFEKSQIAIGRFLKNDLIIDDSLLEGHHLDLWFIENTLIAQPTKSHFPYYLNGKKCFGARKINIGDTLALGKSVLKIMDLKIPQDINYKSFAEKKVAELVNKKSPMVDLLELLQNEILILEGTTNA